MIYKKYKEGLYTIVIVVYFHIFVFEIGSAKFSVGLEALLIGGLLKSYQSEYTDIPCS